MGDWKTLGCMVLAGGIGTLCRYGFARLVTAWLGAAFPWGTLAVNLLGCFLAGLIAASLGRLGPEWRLIGMTGFLGAFTTLSAVAWETVSLAQNGLGLQSGLNFVANTGLGLLAVLLGMWVSGLFYRPLGAV